MYKKVTLILSSTIGILLLNFVLLFEVMATTGSWKSYGNTNPTKLSTATWICSATHSFAPSTPVYGQVCMVRSLDKKYVVGAIVIQNTTNSVYTVYANGDMGRQGDFLLDEWKCESSSIAANSWSVCSGQVFRTRSSSDHQHRATGFVNNFYVGTTPFN